MAPRGRGTTPYTGCHHQLAVKSCEPCQNVVQTQMQNEYTDVGHGSFTGATAHDGVLDVALMN